MRVSRASVRIEDDEDEICEGGKKTGRFASSNEILVREGAGVEGKGKGG